MLRISKIAFTITLIIAITIPCVAQKQRNYIYMFDCTQSMQQKGIWEQAKSTLDRTIELQCRQDGSQFSVIPFQGKTYNTFAFNGSEYTAKKEAIYTKLDTLIKQLTNTNILDVFHNGVKQCNPVYDNRIYLITDGEDNVNGMDKVCKAIAAWCANHKNATFFYVTLNGMVSSPQLARVLNECNDAYLVNVKGGAIPQISDISNEIYTNTLELGKPITVRLSEPGTHKVKVSCNDPYFKVENSGAFIDNTMTIKIEQRQQLPLEELNKRLADYVDDKGNYNFCVTISSDDQNLIIVNPDLTVRMTNREQRTLTLNDGSNDEIIAKPGASWYPSFLWSKAKEQDTINIDLKPLFNKAATQSSWAEFSVTPSDNQPADFTVLYNGNLAENNRDFTVSPGNPGVLSIIFDTDAKTGKRYFSITNQNDSELDLINGEPIGAFKELTLRTSYNIDWNPLKTVCFWLGIILISLLIIWFAILKPLFYPTIKVPKLDFTGPGTYYLTKRIKGNRKVILTSKRRSQNLINRIFTGKILFIRADHWSTDVEIIPGTRKTVRVKGKDWIVTPNNILSLGGTYKIQNTTYKIESNIFVH